MPRNGVVLLALLLLAACTRLGTSPSVKPPVAGAPAGAGDLTSEADRLAANALAALLAGDTRQASAGINKALQLRIDRSYYHLINALCYHLDGKRGDRQALDLAEEGYGQAIHFDPSNWLAFYYRARLRIDAGRFEAAMADAAEALQFRPHDADLLNVFAYAAYRSGRPDLAAGAVAQAVKIGGAAPASLWRNGAMALAALGDRPGAEHYLEAYRQAGGATADIAILTQRLDDWGDLPRAAGDLVPVQFPGGIEQNPYTPGMPYSSPFSGGGLQVDPFSRLTAEDRTTAKGTEDRMVVIDVVMISTTETIGSNKGVNLLNGLTLQFGSLNNPFYGFVRTDMSGAGSTTSITRALTIPSVSYTLNILNANNQHSEVLSRPTLIGLAGKESNFFSGLELNAAAVSGGGSALAGGISIGGGQAINIQKEIGVRLIVLPVVLPDGRLRLAVSAERTFLQTPSEDVNFTFKLETTKDQITANVIMRYGETLILGGLSEKETQYNRDGVPLLQDVPGLQYLFSNETRSDYQKSMLILLTPRPTQYIYQPEEARAAYERTLSEDERPVANLQARYSDWFRPYPNWASIFHHLQENGLYREFRTGDVDLESWTSMQSLSDRLDQITQFLHY